ncbi:MAG: glycosyltransferase family 4 protein [Bryobacteraceae bacterium]
MRLLHVDSGKQMRGGQWQALYLVRGLRERGYTPVLLAPGGTPLRLAAAESGIEAHDLSVLGLAQLARRADLVHVHDARSHTLAALLSLRPLVVSRRVAFPVRRGPLSRWKYGRAAHYIAVSCAVKRELLEAGIPEERVSIVYDGVIVPPLYEVKRTRIVAIAFDDPMKGGDLLERAAALAGVTVDYSRNLPADLASARLFVYVTRQEGLGSGALIAMAAGVPVVVSRVGGLPEIVRHEETGLLTANDPAEIAAAIRRVLDDAGLAARLARNARREVEGRFGVDEMVRKTLEVYERISV